MALDLGIFLEGSQSTFKVKVSENDAQAQFLLDKLTSSDGSVTITETNDGGIETIDLVAASGGGDNFANANLDFDANRTHDLKGFHLTITDTTNGDLFVLDNDGGFALGSGATYASNDNVTIGTNSSTTNTNAIAIGDNSTANGIAVGANSNASGLATVCLGGSTSATSTYGVAIGANSVASGGSDIAINGTAAGGGSVAINGTTNGNDCVAIGDDSQAIATAATALGSNCVSSGNYSISAGRGSTASGERSLAMGFGAIASGTNSYIISGWGTSPYNNTNSVSNSMEIYFNESSPTFRFGNTVDSWLNSTGNFGLGLDTGIGAKLHVKGSGSSDLTTALLVENTSGTDALEIRDDSVIIMANLPTSATGLPTGALWNNSGVMNIA